VCPDPLGHLQATGSDAAGRKQYLYHERWRTQRDREKFQRMVRFARALPRLRRRVSSDLRGDELTRSQVLACATRLLDIGLFRIGGEEYADNGGGLGLATLRRGNVKLRAGSMVFDYPAKGSTRRIVEIDDPPCAEVIGALKRRRGGGAELLACRERRRWIGVRSDEINDYLKQHAGEDFSAKDFRTWNATVLAAVAVGSTTNNGGTKTGRRHTIDAAVRGVAEVLGNTPAVARRAYIDPRIFDCYLAGRTIPGLSSSNRELDWLADSTRRRIELAVLSLLADHGN
jgi:DNA topoisomerase I